VVEYNVDYVTLSWAAPEHDGGSPILNYIVEKRDSMMNMWSQAAKVDSNTFTMKVTNLFEGQNYLFRVAAENQSGRGAYAELLKPVTARLPFGKHTVSRQLLTQLSDFFLSLAVLLIHSTNFWCMHQYELRRMNYSKLIIILYCFMYRCADGTTKLVGGRAQQRLCGFVVGVSGLRWRISSCPVHH